MDAFYLNRESATSLASEFFDSEETANFMCYFDLRALGVDNDTAISLMHINDIVNQYKMLAKKHGTIDEIVDIYKLVFGDFPDELTWTNSAYETETITVDEFVEEIISDYVTARVDGLSREKAYERFAKYAKMSTNHEALSRMRWFDMSDNSVDQFGLTLDEWLNMIADDEGIVFK